MLAGLNAGFHQAVQLGLGAHAPAQSLDGVVVEAGFVEEGAAACGFAAKGHEAHSIGISIWKRLFRRQR